MNVETVIHYSAAAPRPFKAFLNPVRMVRSLLAHRDLILQLAHRDIVGRYRAARLGLLWAVLTPLIMLAIYTFVVSGVLGARWNPNQRGHGEFALYLFCSILVFNLFGEVVTRAPTLVIANPNYVKKVVFPLEVLALSSVLSAIFNMAVGFVVWLVFWGAVRVTLPHVTILCLPLIVVPLCLATVGMAWLLASLGVFVRDVGHVVGLVVQALFFASPVFYSIDSVKGPFRTIMQFNPLTHALEGARRVMVDGGTPNWPLWGVSLVAAGVIALLGYAFFMKSKRAFADVL